MRQAPSPSLSVDWRQRKTCLWPSRPFSASGSRLPGAACVFVGDGPERAKLEKAHPEFIFSGMQQGEALARHFASGDLFVFPSVTETFGNVVTEALASGLVPVAYDYAAPGRYIRQGENGFLAAFGEETAFLEAIDTAVARREFWPALRREARRTAETLDWATVVKNFAGELKTVLNEAH